jgi:hypothetical protein
MFLCVELTTGLNQLQRLKMRGALSPLSSVSWWHISWVQGQLLSYYFRRVREPTFEIKSILVSFHAFEKCTRKFHCDAPVSDISYKISAYRKRSKPTYRSVTKEQNNFITSGVITSKVLIDSCHVLFSANCFCSVLIELAKLKNSG